MPRRGSASLKRAHGAVNEINRVLALSIRGMFRTSKSVPFVEALEAFDHGDGSTPSDSERRIASARSDAEFAQREVDRDFPILHAHATVALWGVLEVSIEDIVSEFLEADHDALTHPGLASIRVPVAEYEALEKADRLRLILSEYSRNTKADLKLGVTKFETLLDVVGLSGSVEDRLRRDLFELQQVRNVLVHRASLVDRRLISACPWLGLTAGDAMRVSPAQYAKYYEAITRYSIGLMVRMLVKEGLTREEAEAELRGPLGGSER